MIVDIFYLLTLILPLATILIVFGMKYRSDAAQSRAAKLNEEAYRSLAEKAVAAQQENAAALGAIQSHVARLSGSLSNVESILKQVG